jgi:hypothetical protein
MLLIALPGYKGTPRTPIVRCYLAIVVSTLITVVLGEGMSKYQIPLLLRPPKLQLA